MLTLDNGSYEIGGRFLFRDSTLQVSPGDRIGLIGRNGSGKTTLLMMLAGEIQPTSGSVSIARDTKIGYLRQELQGREETSTVFEVAMQAFENGLRLEAEIDALLRKLESGEEAVANELSRKQAEYEAMDAYNFEFRCRQILAGLGIGENEQNSPYRNLSGGWRMRVQLAKLLLREPDVLLLDEPTNHLDLPSITWLENYLQVFRGAMIVVSHDRYFLDRLVTRTVEISRARFHFYRGNYSRYLIEKAEREAQHKREFENQQKMVHDTERFINRFRAKATKAKQVQSKIKLLDKIDRILAPEDEGPVVNFRFSVAVNPGKILLDLNIHEKSYGGQKVLGESHLYVNRGDKIALIGANGIGKSTVLRISSGMEPFSGTITTGHNAVVSFYAQHQLDALDVKNEILRELHPFVVKNSETYVRNLLGGFLFSGDDVFKKISVLSGGEKSRVALAKTLLQEANLLLLDEPTNHLDIQSVQILIRALREYPGTLIVVSHDRYFLAEVANKIWYIENKHVKEYPGTYGEFEVSRGNSFHSAPAKQSAKPVAGKKGGNDYKEDKKRKNRIRKLEITIQETETVIGGLESKKERLISEMSDPQVAREFDKLEMLQKQLDDLENQINKLTGEWEANSTELEKLNE